MYAGFRIELYAPFTLGQAENTQKLLAVFVCEAWYLVKVCVFVVD